MGRGKHCLGIHIGHDRGASIVSDGELASSVAEERLDRRKHSNSPELPRRSIDAVLALSGLSPGDLAAVGISYTNVRIEDIIHQLTDEVRDVLGRQTLDVVGASHHDCHAWAGFLTSGERQSMILVADGAGDLAGDGLEAESLYLGEDRTVTLVDRRIQGFGSARPDRRNSYNLAYMAAADQKLQISLGRKYEQLTYLIGFGHGQAGKTMGLAAYSDPLFKYPAPAVQGLQFDLSFEDAIEEVDRLWRASGEAWHRFVRRNAAGIAASAQYLLEGHMLAIARGVGAGRRHRTLCGGEACS